MIRAFLFIALALAIVGYINGIDIKACVEKGRSYETCSALYNP